MSDRADPIVAWLRTYLIESGARGFVVGLSGGVDSALVVRLCQLAAPDHVLGVLLPCYSQPQDEADARLVASTFGIRTARADLSRAFDALAAELDRAVEGLALHPDVVDIKQRLPRVNIKPRLRMTALYFFANSLDYLVAGTGNRSEIALGYYTKYGDGGVDLLPIGNLLKSEVRDLAAELGVPARIVDRPPSAGLWPGQTDEAELGFTYAVLEQYLTDGGRVVSAEAAHRIERLRTAAEHKAALPPTAPFTKS